MKKIVIVGGNHAGIAAATTAIQQAGQQVTIYEKKEHISYLGCGTALWLGEQMDEPAQLFYTSKEELERKGIRVQLNANVQFIDFSKQQLLITSHGQQFVETYDELILATGSKPIVPDLPGIDLAQIQCIKTFQEAVSAQQLLQQESTKHVAIIGAGAIGIEMAEACKRNGKHVRLFESQAHVLAANYDAPFSELMEKTLETRGVHLHLGEEIRAFKGEQTVTTLVTNQGEYAVDLVFLAVGFLPDHTLGKEALQLSQKGAYLVDAKQQTSMPHVYAVGDCAVVMQNAAQDTAYQALATNAVRSGVIAGANASGQTLESPGVQGSSALSIFGLHLFSTGWTYTKAKTVHPHAAYVEHEDFQKPAFMKTDNHLVRLRIVYDQQTRRILGAQLASKLDISGMTHLFSLAIQEQFSIDKLKLLDLFFLPHFNTPYNYVTMAALKA